MGYSIEAVIFDFDGLIRDTETFEFYSFQEIFREYGVELPLDLYCKRIGGHMKTFIQIRLPKMAAWQFSY